MTRTSTSLLLLLLSAPAFAGPEEDARAAFGEGRRLFRERDYAAARAQFEEANRILPNPRVYGNIAACFEAERNPAEAVRTYRRFLYEGGEQVDAGGRAGADRAIARLRRDVADLVFAIEPVGAEVRVDGIVMGSAPLPWPVAVAPGARLVEVRAYEHTPYSRTVQAVPGEEVAVQVVLDRIVATPAAAVEPRGEPEPEPDAQAEPRQDPASQPPESTPLGRGPLFGVGLGLTAALAVGGTVTGLLALSAETDAGDQSLPLGERAEAFDRANSMATITDVLVDAAVVVGVATAALWFFAGPDGQESPPVALAATPGGLRCDWRTSF